MGRVTRYLDFGPYRVDPEQRLLLRGEEEIPLTPKTFDTLLVLVEHAGRILTKDDLMRAVWPDTVVEENNLTQNISRLRKVLGNGVNGQTFIETIPKRGYRFLAEVRQLQAPEHELLFQRQTRWTYIEEEEEKEEEEEEPQPAIAVAVPHGASPASRMGRPTVAALMVVAAMIAAAVWVWSAAAARRQGAVTRPSDRMTIARVTRAGNVVAGAISPDGKYVVHAVSDAGLQSLWVTQISTASSVQIVPPAPVDYWGVTLSADGGFVYCVTWQRNKTDAVLFRVPILGGVRRSLLEGADGAISFSPEGRHFAYGATRSSRGESLLMMANVDGSDRQTFIRRSGGELFNGANSGGPAWSPDGNVIASALGRTVSGFRRQHLVQLAREERQPRQIAPQVWVNMGRITWLNDGSGLLFTARDRVDSPDQVWLVSYPAGIAARVTNDLLDYSHVSVTADGEALAAVQTQTVSTIWVAPSDDPSRAREIFSEVGGCQGTEGLSWGPGGELVYRSAAGDGLHLFVMDAEGRNRRQLTSQSGAYFHPAVSRDGRFLVFASDRSGRLCVWRLDLEDGSFKQLTRGTDDVRPQISPDGQWIVYQQGHGVARATIWKAPVVGGEAVPLTTTESIRPAISPDGRFVAYYYMDAERWGLAVMRIEGGPPIARFDIPPTSGSRVMRWMPDGRALAYVDDRGGVSNILIQRLEGGAPEQLTHFTSGRLVFFDWSPDGSRLALVRAEQTSDVVRISHFTPAN